eukprot:CAMPEP_0183304400 /NCGR_PEP_ID=MMETSP0160_2-20130417/9490_1 /TAXON_ID=2839 ORGANISM="Odontella Sinensis, Strain Grunow 1884" /NCGR_SAMPLE_ID=MMETSP0160_2 /ASSEMBLY_ACC=CAM_ASM_000250 /LENGTH=406 /DNA_ID=CAMNT_0025467441 /DNA_START=27 /DNA_END=1250 /DNA_ORIENTATION=-
MMLLFSRVLAASTAVVLVLALSLGHLQTTTWWAGYDLQNCPNCKPIVDWSDELSRNTVAGVQRRKFASDGVVVLSGAISPVKVSTLSDEVDSMVDTFMTSVLSKVVLRGYRKYEHRLDTRSELVRDWAVHGALAKWAAQLMDVKEARLYNAEKIYSAGADNPMGCNPAWHRDTVAAPFPIDAKSVTINIYLDDIGADGPHGDALIFIRGSHKDLDTPPAVTGKRLFEPVIKVGDVLAHDPNVYHTPSGRGCWNRRSLQFRYVESPTTFDFEPIRFPHGPIPWTLAHAPGLAPHGLKEGDALAGPWYPKVYPEPQEDEHITLKGKAWGIFSLLGVAKQAQDAAAKLGIGSDDDCIADVRNESDGYLYYGFDGPVAKCKDWEMLNGLPVHKEGQMINDMKRLMEKVKK